MGIKIKIILTQTILILILVAISFISTPASATHFLSNTSEASPAEENLFNTLLERVQKNSAHMPHPVNDTINTFNRTLHKEVSCSAFSEKVVDLVNIFVSTQLRGWNKSLAPKNANAAYLWDCHPNISKVGDKTKKTVNCTNVIILDEPVISQGEEILIGELDNKRLMYHELLHGQLLIDALNNSEWQKEICNCNFNSTPADKNHTKIGSLETQFLESIARVHGIKIIKEEIDSRAARNGRFTTGIMVPLAKVRAGFVAANVPIENVEDANFVLDRSGRIKIFPGNRIRVTGQLTDPTKNGEIRVYIDPENIGKIVKINILPFVFEVPEIFIEEKWELCEINNFLLPLDPNFPMICPEDEEGNRKIIKCAVVCDPANKGIAKVGALEFGPEFQECKQEFFEECSEKCALQEGIDENCFKECILRECDREGVKISEEKLEIAKPSDECSITAEIFDPELKFKDFCTVYQGEFRTKKLGNYEVMIFAEEESASTGCVGEPSMDSCREYTKEQCLMAEKNGLGCRLGEECAGTPKLACEEIGNIFGIEKCEETKGCEIIPSECVGRFSCFQIKDMGVCRQIPGCRVLSLPGLSICVGRGKCSFFNDNLALCEELKRCKLKGKCEGIPKKNACEAYNAKQCAIIPGCEPFSGCVGTVNSCKELGLKLGIQKCLETRGCRFNYAIKQNEFELAVCLFPQALGGEPFA